MSISLVCIPFAGSGAGFYRPWDAIDTAPFDVVPMQLPGREERFVDPPHSDVVTAAKELAPQILDRVPSGPLVLFGHSLGAVVAFETARELVRSGTDRLVCLVVSGSPGPWTGRTARATGLADEEFLTRVVEFAGYRHEAFDDPDMRELLLPLLRADVAMHEDYRSASGEPLSVPVIALRGDRDSLVDADAVEQWRAATSERFVSREIPGGHMYLVDGPAQLVSVIGPLVAGFGDD